VLKTTEDLIKELKEDISGTENCATHHLACSCLNARIVSAFREEEKERKQAIDRSIRIMMNMPCKDHSGDKAPSFQDFLKRVDGKCLLCLIDEVKALRRELISDLG